VAATDLLNLVHDEAYVLKVVSWAMHAGHDASQMLEDTQGQGDADTKGGAASLGAVKGAVLSVAEAVTRVLAGQLANSFVLVRPPGHHAGFSGLVVPGGTQGFCLVRACARALRACVACVRHSLAPGASCAEFGDP
jgi:acetoin utilization deacetylase AcuC-like enzyme